MVSHQSHKLKVVGSIPTVRNQVLLLGVLELPNREGKSLTLSESLFQCSTAVVQLTVNQLVVGSIPATGANLCG